MSVSLLIKKCLFQISKMSAGGSRPPSRGGSDNSRRQSARKSTNAAARRAPPVVERPHDAMNYLERAVVDLNLSDESSSDESESLAGPANLYQSSRLFYQVPWASQRGNEGADQPTVRTHNRPRHMGDSDAVSISDHQSSEESDCPLIPASRGANLAPFTFVERMKAEASNALRAMPSYNQTLVSVFKHLIIQNQQYSVFLIFLAADHLPSYCDTP